MKFLDKLKEKRMQKEVDKKLKEEEQKKIVEQPKDKPTGLKSQLADITEKLNKITMEKQTTEQLKKKSFKMPFKVKSQLKKLAKKSKVQVILLQNNRNIKPTIGEIKNGMLVIGEKIYDGSSDGIWLWNGKFPTALVAEWDLKPLTPELLYEDTLKHKRLADPQTIMIRAFELKESMQPNKLGGKTLIFILVAGVIVFYVLFAGGGD